VIPVDYVADYCIVTGALMANCKQLNVFHCCSSNSNPVTWGLMRKSIMLYW